MKKVLSLVLAIVLSFRLFSQTPVDVAESTLKVRGLSNSILLWLCRRRSGHLQFCRTSWEKTESRGDY